MRLERKADSVKEMKGRNHSGILNERSVRDTMGKNCLSTLLPAI